MNQTVFIDKVPKCKTAEGYLLFNIYFYSADLSEVLWDYLLKEYILLLLKSTYFASTIQSLNSPKHDKEVNWNSETSSFSKLLNFYN